jgi:hypothetical protein
MNTKRRPPVITEDKHPHTHRRAKESTVKTTASNLSRWAGLSAVVAGTCFVVLALLHPPETLSSVTTTRWAIAHAVGIAMSLFGLLGMTGLYARQAEAAGWLGLAGYVLLSLWLALLLPYTFFEAVILPLLATEAPTFAEGFLGMVGGPAGETTFGVLAALWTLLGVLLVLGGLLFGIATLRAGILPRWPAGLLAVGVELTPPRSGAARGRPVARPRGR